MGTKQSIKWYRNCPHFCEPVFIRTMLIESQLGEELEYTEFYLYLQKMRFEGRFFYKIIVEDEELKKSIIPKFVIEPIVEMR